MAKHNVWLSVSDLMTGLMVIFLFVAISYISKVKENQSVLDDYVETKTKLHEKMVNAFAGDTLEWKMAIGKDLTMKFKDPMVLFAVGAYQLTPEFEKILDKFLPRYFDILLKDILSNRIKEIRIEGHTDDTPMPSYHSDPYIANTILSQQRALSVLQYIRNMKAYQDYSADERRQLEYWLTSNGLSYGKSLDSDGNYTYSTGKSIDKDLSRRVEFRIVTTGDEILENFVINNSQNQQ